MAYQSTKGGRPVNPRKRRGYGFHWFGRDDHGVHIWGGQVEALKWGVRILAFTGAGTIIAGIASLLFGAPVEAPAVFALIGAIHSSIAYVMYRQKKRIEQLATPELAAADLGFSPEQIQDMVENEGIKPRMIINGEPYFDPTDLGQAATLLRTAASPGDDSLLHPVSAVESGTAHLLKPAEPESNRNLTMEDRNSEEPLPLRQDTGNA